MKKILSIVLGLFIAYGSLKLYLYYEVKQSLDNLLAKADPFAQISYQSFSTAPFKGTVSIHDVKILTPRKNENLSIDSITIAGLEFYPPHQIALSAFDFKKPSEKSVQLKGVHHEASSKFLSSFFRQPTSTYKVNFIPQEMPLEKLGYSNIISDIMISLTPQQKNNQMRLQYSQTNYDMFSIHLEMLIDIPSIASYKQIQLYEGALTYHDLSFAKRMMKLVAEEDHISTEVLQQNVMKNLNAELENKIKLDIKDIDAIKAFLANPETLIVSIQPYEPLDMDTLGTLHLYKSSDIPKILNLTITAH